MDELIFPNELRFAITRKCDGLCRHCYNHSGRCMDELSSDDFISILNEVYSFNPSLDRITLTGGEPLLEKEKVLQISRFAQSLNIRVRLVTRGWELNRQLCIELKESGVTRLQIGLDSSGKTGYTNNYSNEWDTVHSWLRGDPEGFKKTIVAIQLAVACGMNVSIRYSLCKSNFQDVINTYQLVSSLGVSKFKFRVLFPDGRAKSSLVSELIYGEEMATAQFDLIMASKGNRTEVEITQPCWYDLSARSFPETNCFKINAFKESCPCGTIAAYIDANGDVKYCLFDEGILGNVASDSLLNVWNSEKAKESRKLRCPLDKSGMGCSTFKLLYEQFNDYSVFMREYSEKVRANQELI